MAKRADQPQLFKAPSLTEKEFQKAVVKRAKELGFLVMHAERAMVRNSDGSRRWITNTVKGFPDLVLVKPPRIIFLELKKDRRSKMSDEQTEWLSALQRCSEIEAFCVTPTDGAYIEEMLSE